MHDIHSRNLEGPLNTKCNVGERAGSTPSVQGGGGRGRQSTRIREGTWGVEKRAPDKSAAHC
jgi:hypothetical protein